jgi:SAM-dependent methyltransferase
VASAIGVAQYVAIAAEVATRLRASGGGLRVLDWGAGWGQTSLLLRAHGLDVVAYDVEDKGAAAGLLAGAGVGYVVERGATLPFAGGAFDGVLNCGVLEHTDDPPAALAQIRRVLAAGGWLFTYHLPNRHAWAEWLGRRRGGFYHEQTYTRRGAIALFEAAGFQVVGVRPFHLLPRNVWGRSPGRARLAGHVAGAFEQADAGLVRVPGLRRLATAWALLARRPG